MTQHTDHLDRCDNCGRFGWHTTARCPEPATSAEIATEDESVELTREQREAQMRAYQLRDTLRRIENILRVYPTAEWTLDEAHAVLSALSGIVCVRQGAFTGLRVTVTITSPSGGPDIDVSTRLPRPEVK